MIKQRILLVLFFFGFLAPHKSFCADLGTVTVSQEFTVFSFDIENITISPGTLPPNNPCGITTGSTVNYEVTVKPDSVADSDIKWTIEKGGLSFPGGDSGRIVSLKGDSAGEATLKAEINPDANDVINLKVADEKIAKLKIYIVRKDDGTGAAADETWVNNDISDANKIWSQCAIKFEKDGSINYIDKTAWLEADGKSGDLKEIGEIGRYAYNTKAVEIYYINKFTDPTLSAATGVTNPASTKEAGVFLTKEGNSRTFAHEVGHAMGLEDIYEGSESDAAEKELIKKLLMFGRKSDTKADIPLGREWGKKVGWSDVTKYESW